MKLRRLVSVLLVGVMVLSMAACGGSNGKQEDTTQKTTSKKEPAETMSLQILPNNMVTTNNGVFEGWGTSLCWWANRIGYSDELSQQAADLFFGDDGLRFNIMRYNIGGGDDPTHKHITRTDSAVPGWLVYDEASQKFVYDYDADYNQLNVLKRAYEAAGDDVYVEVFSNSPPYFMTESGCSSGNTNASQDNLKPDYYEEFAEYMAHVSEYIQNTLGVTIKSVSPMNEPNTSYWGEGSWKQEGCHVTPGKAQSSIIVETAKAFENVGLGEVLIIASDETSPDLAASSMNHYSDEAYQVIDRISTHTYSNGGMSTLRKLCEKKNLNLWMSEVDGNGKSGFLAGEMSSALWMAEKIISDINGLQPSAWVMWQVIDNHISKEGYNGNKDTGMVNTHEGFWGAAVADHDNVNIRLTQKYYGIGQFTRYITPGSTLIVIGSKALGAYNPETKELTVVVVNSLREEVECSIDLTKLKSHGDTAKVIRTSGGLKNGESWAELPNETVGQDELVTTLKANSITTFIISDVEMK